MERKVKSKLEVLYFYKSYYDDEEYIMDVGWFWLSDPLFLDKYWKQITKRSEINSISRVFIWICRPSFRHFIKFHLDNYSEIIFHMYIKSTNNEWKRIWKYVKSFKICKELTSGNHKDGLDLNFEHFDNLSKQYNKIKSHYWKKTDIKKTPLLVLYPYDIDYKKTIIIDWIWNPNFRFRYIWSKFTNFNQTQWFLPYRESE